MTGSGPDSPEEEPVVIVRVGAAGGDVTLFGQVGPEGSWRFKRKTVDQTQLLLGDADTSWHSESGWVDGWEAALQQLDRYPWAMLHPLEVRPRFRDRVQSAVGERLDRVRPSRQVERAREKWRALLEGRSD